LIRSPTPALLLARGEVWRGGIPSESLICSLRYPRAFATCSSAGGAGTGLETFILYDLQYTTRISATSHHYAAQQGNTHATSHSVSPDLDNSDRACPATARSIGRYQRR